MVLKVLKGSDIGKYPAGMTEAYRHLFFGASGSGKSRMLLTIPEHELLKSIPAEKIKVFVLDFDGGIESVLVSQFPQEYREFFEFIEVNNNMDNVREATAYIQKATKEHLNKHSHRPYIAIDNLDAYWTLSQDAFVQEAYGVDLATKSTRVIRDMIKAKEVDDFKGESFTMTEDWRGIKGLHRQYRDGLFHCGSHVVATSTEQEKRDANNKFALVGMEPGGEKQEKKGYKFHFISYMAVMTDTTIVNGTLLKREGVQKFACIMLKSRFSANDKAWKNKDITFHNYMTAIESDYVANIAKFSASKGTLMDKLKLTHTTEGVNVVEPSNVTPTEQSTAKQGADDLGTDGEF